MEDSSYVPVAKKQFPKSRNPITSDSKFWRQFKSKVSEQQIAGVTSLDFSPVSPYDLAVTSSTRISILNGKTCDKKRTISKFTDFAYSGNFRSDGQLIVAGGETGVIQVFDISSRRTLAQLKGHTSSVRWVRYSNTDKLHVLSGSDDHIVKWWDIPSKTPVVSFQEHNDYVRCGSYNPVSPDIWATGSYDHTVKLWDTRAGKSVAQLQHGKPLEDVLFFPSGGLLATAGGNMVKIWDVVSGGKLLKTLGNFQKTVTALTLTMPCRTGSVLVDSSPRLLTGSLDGHVKVFDVHQFKTVHTAKYPAPILSMAVSPECNTLAVGMSTGLLSVRQRKDTPVENAVEVQETKRFHGGTTRYFLRGRTEKASEDDYVLGHYRKPSHGEHDRLLLKFRYKDALVAALKTLDPTVVVAVIEELVARKGLVQSLSNLEICELELVLTFLTKYIAVPKYSRLLVPLTHSLLDQCATNLGASEAVKSKVLALKEKVQQEVKLQESLQSCQGMLQVLIQAGARSA